MSGFFAAVLLLAAAEPPDALQPRAVVYGYPSSTLGMVFLEGFVPSPPFYGVVGTSVRLSGAVGVDAELAGGALAGTAGWIFSLGAGPSLQLTGEDTFADCSWPHVFALRLFDRQATSGPRRPGVCLPLQLRRRLLLSASSTSGITCASVVSTSHP